MLFAKLAWDKTTAYVLMNEILMTKFLYLTGAYPDLKVHPEAQSIIEKLKSTYHGNLDLLDFITDKLQEKDRSQSSSLTEEEEHANEIRNILNQIYRDTDTS